jgi:hypothetical protein
VKLSHSDAVFGSEAVLAVTTAFAPTARLAVVGEIGILQQQRTANLVERARRMVHGSTPTVILFREVSTIAQFQKST